MEDFFSESSSLYFFSAILQANAALLALVGIFLIFRLQYFQSIIDGVRNKLINTTSKLNLLNTIINFEEKQIEERIGTRTGDDLIDYLLNVWNLQEMEIRFLKSNIMMPVFLIFIGIIICVLGLVVSSKVHNCYGTFEFWLLFVVAAFHIFTYWLNTYTVLFLILSGNRDTSSKLHINCYKIVGWVYRLFRFPKYEHIKSND